VEVGGGGFGEGTLSPRPRPRLAPNAEILTPHLHCAAWERPLSPEEHAAGPTLWGTAYLPSGPPPAPTVPLGGGGSGRPPRTCGPGCLIPENPGNSIDISINRQADCPT